MELNGSGSSRYVSNSSSADSPESHSSIGCFIKHFVRDAVYAIIGRVFSTILSFLFAMVGTLLGAMTGALIGQETECGFMKGASIGAISGAVFSIEVFESSLVIWQSDESGIRCVLYLIYVLTRSLLSGQLVRERIDPAMLSAVQSQMGAVETTYEEAHSIVDTGGAKDLLVDTLEKIPTFVITRGNNLDSSGEKVTCSVCLQDFQIGESSRKITKL